MVNTEDTFREAEILQLYLQGVKTCFDLHTRTVCDRTYRMYQNVKENVKENSFRVAWSKTENMA